MIFRLKDAFIRKTDYIEMRNYITKAVSSSLSLTIGILDGLYPKTASETNDRAYFVIEGEGTFHVGDESWRVGPDDTIYVPKGTPYSIEGKMKIVIINSPAFGL